MESKSLCKKEFFDIVDKSKSGNEILLAIRQFVPKRLYKFYSIPEDNDKRNSRFTQLENEQIWFSKKEFLNDPFEFEHLSLTHASPEAISYYNEVLSEIELVCLTASPFSKLMWSHYADAYKGFCVEFTVPDPVFILPVIYDDSIVNLSASYQRLFESREKLHPTQWPYKKSEVSKDIVKLNYPLLSKDICWQYEHEFRILTNMPADPCKGHLHFAPNYGLHISKIIVGRNCKSEYANELYEVVDRVNSKRFANFKSTLTHENCNEHFDVCAMKLWKYTNIWNRPVSIKTLSWDNELNLVEKSFSEDNANGQAEI